jgi:hypothetical protein
MSSYPTLSFWLAPARWAAPCWRAGSRAGSRRGVTILDPHPAPAMVALAARHGIALNPPLATMPRRSAGAGDQAADARRRRADAGRASPAPKRWLSRCSPARPSPISPSGCLAPAPFVRAMPNTPAAVGRGITGRRRLPAVMRRRRRWPIRLLKAVGRVEWLEAKKLIDAVTALSGSGPAYVFYLAECLAKAGVGRGPAGRCRGPHGARHGGRGGRTDVSGCRDRAVANCGSTSPRPAAPPLPRWRC